MGEFLPFPLSRAPDPRFSSRYLPLCDSYACDRSPLPCRWSESSCGLPCRAKNASGANAAVPLLRLHPELLDEPIPILKKPAGHFDPADHDAPHCLLIFGLLQDDGHAFIRHLGKQAHPVVHLNAQLLKICGECREDHFPNFGSENDQVGFGLAFHVNSSVRNKNSGYDRVLGHNRCFSAISRHSHDIIESQTLAVQKSKRL